MRVSRHYFVFFALLSSGLLEGCVSGGRSQAKVHDAGMRNCSLRDMNDDLCAPSSRQAKVEKNSEKY